VYDDASPRDRPKYGALNFRAYPAGAAPRFGSAHFRLAAHTLERTTFCYPDSVFNPEDFGVAARMSLLELALADDQDLLDDYVEEQVHGPVELERDAEALVLDPCFRGTEVEVQASELGCPVEWYEGSGSRSTSFCRTRSTAGRSSWRSVWTWPGAATSTADHRGSLGHQTVRPAVAQAGLAPRRSVRPTEG
jgi:Protein of unknown function (DUF3626)